MDLASIEKRVDERYHAAAKSCDSGLDTAGDGANALGHSTQMADEAHARRVRLGDPVAFAALTVHHWGAVHRMARSMLRDASEADEATEETFLLALRSAELFPPDVPFRTSLYRVAMDRALTRLRSSPRDAGSAADFFPTFGASGRLATGESEWSGFGEALIRRTDLAAQIREGLGRIDELDRASFVLRDVEQLPAEEVAAILRASPEEIRERAHRARLMMAGFLARLVSSSAGRGERRWTSKTSND